MRENLESENDIVAMWEEFSIVSSLIKSLPIDNLRHSILARN